jgi:hypothetical protein
MPVSFDFDFLKPDYIKVFNHRLKMAERLKDANYVTAMKTFYRHNPAQFINDWGCTFDPRNADIGLPSVVPFILFDKQEEWIDWLLQHWRDRQPGITEKSRDMGLSWLSVSVACTICLFNPGVVIGFGSRKEEYVDKIGAPKSLFWKAREFLRYVPRPFLDGFSLKQHAPHMRIMFPGTNSVITGESGDGIGRGDRTSIYFVDESAYIERPELVEASLSQTTNCRQDISSAHGMGNPFAQKRFSGKIDVFTFNWRDDPRKNPAHKIPYKGRMVTWYEKMQEELDPVTLAQEVDINYSASLEGIVIPSAWVQAAIGAARKLGIVPTGGKFGALDIADRGKDKCAIAARHGIELFSLKSWSGKDSDTLYSVEKAFHFVDENHLEEMAYDADGMGALVRGDSRMINERRAKNRERSIGVVPFRGSGEVIDPEKEMIKGRKNKDYFQNRKAQAWWALRLKFNNTFRAIEMLRTGEVAEYDKDDLISISETCPELQQLVSELSQPTYTINTAGKILIDKAPDNTRSPNNADAVMMVYSPKKRHNGLFSVVDKG